MFINYRSTDASSSALLHEVLSDRFGAESVFLDYESIPPGRDFATVLMERVVHSAVLLVVVGERWLDGEIGARPIDDPNDWVRREILAALEHGGPCVDCIRTGVPVSSTDLAADAGRWPRYAAAAEACGFSAVHVLPMRLRRDVIGVLSLLNTHTDGVGETMSDLGQALADVATIGILQQRGLKHSQEVTEQLQTALNTRVIIEQAKGMLAATRADTTPAEAFVALRGFARAHHLKLTTLAQDVVDGHADRDAILGHSA